MTEECCGNCKFSIEITNGIINLWRCRRYPPTEMGARSGTSERSWCGEWQITNWDADE